MWFLQGVEAASFQTRVSAAKIREVLIPPERGRIFDAKGRIMADNVLDYRFVALSHNTIRGAAGAAILNAELLMATEKLK